MSSRNDEKISKELRCVPLSRHRWQRRREWVDGLAASNEARRRSPREDVDAAAAAILPQQLVRCRSSMVRLRWTNLWRLVAEERLFLREEDESSLCWNESSSSNCSVAVAVGAVGFWGVGDVTSSGFEAKTSVLFVYLRSRLVVWCRWCGDWTARGILDVETALLSRTNFSWRA